MKILCLGDSFTKGVGAEKGRSYPDYLGKIIRDNNRYCNVEILNFGFGGAPAEISYQYLRKFFRRSEYLPDLVLVATGINNVKSWRIRTEFLKSIEKPSYFVMPIAVLRRFYSFRLVYFLYGKINIFDRDGRTNGELISAFNLKEFEQYWMEELESELFLIQSACRSKGVEPIVVSYHLSSEKLFNTIHSAAKSTNCKFIDLFHFMSEDQWEKGGFLTDWHPNGKGYQLIAFEIYNNLCKMRVDADKDHACFQEPRKSG